MIRLLSLFRAMQDAIIIKTQFYCQGMAKDERSAVALKLPRVRPR